MRERANKTKQLVRTIQSSGRNQGVGFVDNRSKIILQRMKAYDGSNPLTDPRHFSTSDIKRAIDLCVSSKTLIPGWLHEQFSNYLRDELSERHKEMERHGGGDSGHIHYFHHVQNYVEKIESLETTEDEDKQVPLSGPAAQLCNT